jgi:hypothetical protein
MNEFRSASSENSSIELFIDGKSKGVFPTLKMANKYLQNNVYNLSSSSILKIESSGVSQKNDETPVVKRRGRPKKADNDRAKLL